MSARFTASAPPERPERLRLRWPSQEHLVPEQCGHCGANRLFGDLPNEDHRLVEVVCYACSQLICDLEHDSFRPPLPPVRRGRPSTYATAAERQEARRAQHRANRERLARKAGS